MAMTKAHVSAHELVAGRYRLLEVASREVNRICWYAEDVETQQPRLVTRIVLPERAADENARRTTDRVLRTSEVMSLLRPGRVATVLDAIEETGTLWTVADWIDGTPLGELLAQQGAFNHVRVARIGLELLDVLEAAHGEGLTHGELSPGQVFVPDRGPVVVTGFGLAGATLAPRITAPSYASPEQARDERIGPSADLWALGAILYTLVEGRPPFRDRGRPETTLKGVDRLPLRTPLRAGPLARTVQGLLRKNSRERLTRPVVRDALGRILTEDDAAGLRTSPVPRLRVAYAGALRTGRDWSTRTMVAGTALAVVTVSLAVLAATQMLARPGTSATGAPPRTSAAATPTGDGTDGSASPPPSSSGLPAGFRRYTAPEGFSVALPDGWDRRATRADGLAYRVTFGPDGDDARALAVTYSERVGPDPVAVWRDDVQPDLEQLDGFRRIGDIRATTYQGNAAADMSWVSGSGDDRVRTFGRGFLIGGQRGYSLRFTTPADAWNDAAGRLVLKTVLQTFREPAR
ncbi:serine/threonine-protein kinase [Streptomyces sp. NPDC046805]|uniref:serine/threonine protein kinase n=1 Tax=Streptomyces sp. NPDC046805 TaxID=3155134 RepID=UPI0033DC86A2